MNRLQRGMRPALVAMGAAVALQVSVGQVLAGVLQAKVLAFSQYLGVHVATQGALYYFYGSTIWSVRQAGGHPGRTDGRQGGAHRWAGWVGAVAGRWAVGCELGSS